MGRGAGKKEVGRIGLRGTGDLREVAVGEVWRGAEGRELTILGAVPEHAWLCLLARDRIGICMIEPKVLARDYTLVEEAPEGSLRLDVSPKGRFSSPRRKAPKAMSPRQAGWLRRLCKEGGVDFDETWDSDQASQMIRTLTRG